MSDKELEAAAGQYLAGIKSNPGMDAAAVEQMEDLFHRKLWHQLTVLIVDSIKSGMLSGDTLIMFYECVIKAIETKCNPLQVVMMAVAVSKQHTDHSTALTFLQAVLDRITNRRMEKVSDTEAGIYVKMRIAWHRLELGEVDTCKAIIDECQALLDVLLETDNVISSAFYNTKAQYFKRKAASGEFYKAALRYLTYTPIETIEPQQKTELARDLCLAALVTDSIFTFGEILMHPILEALKGSEHEWMLLMIAALNYGRISEYEQLWTSHAAAIGAHPIVGSNRQVPSVG